MQANTSEAQQSDKEVPRTGGDDAVCFTSGPIGAPFAAGVIHAWLAMDRRQPLVASGISLGAFSAAAMRRVYQELEDHRPLSLEQKRWSWFRKYLNAVTNNPLRSLWASLPDPVDFSATTSPVSDTSVPSSLKTESEEARRHHLILTKLGVWLANLPVRVATVATIVVMYVRKKERYGSWRDRWLYYWNCFKLILGVWWHVVWSPSPVNEAEYKTANEKPSWRNLFGLVMHRPLFREVWWIALGLGAALALLILLIVAFGLLPLVSLHVFESSHQHQRPSSLYWVIVFVWAFVVPIGFSWAFAKQVNRRGASLREYLLSKLLNRVDIDQALLHSYEADRQIYDLFVDQAPESAHKTHESHVRLLVVCAALERTEQVCLRDDLNIQDALMAAIALPGLFKPKVLSSEAVYPSKDYPSPNPVSLNLIDGSAVRTNPLPAFFEWCKCKEHHDIALLLEKQTPSLHVVYSVPLGYPESLQSALSLRCPDVVQSAKLGLDLEKRRDTRQEVRQTRYTSELENLRRKVSRQSEAGPRGPFAIFADEIAPSMDINEADQPESNSERLIALTAEGCRTTLETLYRKEIEVLGKGDSVACTQLLQKIGGRRAGQLDSFAGLPEVCAACTQKLSLRPERSKHGPPPGLSQSFGASNPGPEYLRKEFKHLAKPGNIVFLGSGGVFRGSFHVGVIAAMAVAHLYPDLVVGASVGTLMGGALCRLSAGDENCEIEVLEGLASIFLDVDTNVALTKVLKSAAKQLGIRARAISLSPAELSRMVRRGSKADPGYAATGAPPALIDAISYLFAIPHQTTKDVASDFVAGHISDSVQKFLAALRSESLSALEIKSFLMGTSLLEDQVRKLLGHNKPGVDLSAVQPYHHPVSGRNKVSYFGTTSFLNAGVSMLLGRDFLTTNPTWDATNMGLCSSAFPVVFAARTEADLLPGRGLPNRYFADGGLFDNLPFLPAIEVLSAVQGSGLEETQQEIREVLRQRAKKPNLLISAGLNALPRKGGEYPNMLQIKKRASTLGFKSKTDSFTRGAQKTLSSLREIAKKEDWNCLDDSELEFLKTSVPATILPVWPSSEDHLNGTFAFCRSLGLNAEVIQRSIGDGCFRTLEAICNEPTIGDYVDEESRIRSLISRKAQEIASPQCPFFERGGKPFYCPFAASDQKPVQDIRDICAHDRMHGFTE